MKIQLLGHIGWPSVNTTPYLISYQPEVTPRDNMRTLRFNIFFRNFLLGLQCLSLALAPSLALAQNTNSNDQQNQVTQSSVSDEALQDEVNQDEVIGTVDGTDLPIRQSSQTITLSWPEGTKGAPEPQSMLVTVDYVQTENSGDYEKAVTWYNAEQAKLKDVPSQEYQVGIEGQVLEHPAAESVDYNKIEKIEIPLTWMEKLKFVVKDAYDNANSRLELKDLKAKDKNAKTFEESYARVTKFLKHPETTRWTLAVVKTVMVGGVMWAGFMKSSTPFNTSLAVASSMGVLSGLIQFYQAQFYHWLIHKGVTMSVVSSLGAKMSATLEGTDYKNLKSDFLNSSRIYNFQKELKWYLTEVAFIGIAAALFRGLGHPIYESLSSGIFHSFFIALLALKGQGKWDGVLAEERGHQLRELIQSKPTDEIYEKQLQHIDRIANVKGFAVAGFANLGTAISISMSSGDNSSYLGYMVLAGMYISARLYELRHDPKFKKWVSNTTEKVQNTCSELLLGSGKKSNP